MTGTLDALCPHEIEQHLIQYVDRYIKMNQNTSSPTLGLYGRLKCCHSRLGSACLGSSVWERSPRVGAVEAVGGLLCLWWVKLSLQTKAPGWVHCHHLSERHIYLY